MVLASRGFAQPVDRPVVDSRMPQSGSATVWPGWQRDAIAEGVTQLQSSGMLGKARKLVRSRAAMPSSEGSATVSRETPELRLKPSLRTGQPPAGAMVVTPDVPGQVLNLEGLVPASRMQVRDGVIVLEGDAMVQPKAPPSDDSSMRDVSPDRSVQVMRED